VADADNRAFRLGAGEGRRLRAFVDLMILKLTADQTSGRVAPAGLEGFFAATAVDATTTTHPPADLPEMPDDPDLAGRYGTTPLGPEPRWAPRHCAS